MRAIERYVHSHLDSYHVRYLCIIFFCLYLLITALCFNSPAEIWRGLGTLVGSSDRLLTDYMALANIGAALTNAAIMTMVHLMILHHWRLELKSQHIAALLTLAGFSLFGKNFINWIPLFLGVIAYAKIKRHDVRESATRALFVSSLGPLVSETNFILRGILVEHMPYWSANLLSAGVASVVGFVAGLVFTPLCYAFVSFHQGFSLYNGGFVAGILAMVANATYRAFGIDIPAREILLKGYNKELFIFVAIFQIGAILVGTAMDRSAWYRYGLILRTTGVNQPNYAKNFGAGATLINSGLLGLVTTLYVFFTGGQLNGPVIGGIFTVMGFAFIGKTLRSALPIYIGVFLATLLHSIDKSSTTANLAAIFGTTLCPVSGYFGFLPGILTGFLHMMLIVSVGTLNSGLNLYHNGFSGAFVAAILVPIFYTLKLGHHGIPEVEDVADEAKHHIPLEPEHESAFTAAALAAEELDEAVEETLFVHDHAGDNPEDLHWGS